jgi:hypothetical protein
MKDMILRFTDKGVIYIEEKIQEIIKLYFEGYPLKEVIKEVGNEIIQTSSECSRTN